MSRVWTYILSTICLCAIIADAQLSTTVIGSGVEGDAVLSTSPESVLMRNPTFTEDIGDGMGVRLAFADTGNHVVRLLSQGVVTVIVGTPGQSGASGDNTTAVDALINAPKGLLQSVLFGFIFCDSGNHRLMRLDPGTQTIHTLAGTGNSSDFSCSGLTQSTLDDTIYIADTINEAIWSIDQNGTLTNLNISLVGPPVDIAFVPTLGPVSNLLLVTIPSRHVVVLANTSFSLGTLDEPGYTRGGGSILNRGNFNRPTHIASVFVSAMELSLVISDTGNQVVRVASLSGGSLIIWTLLGNTTRGFDGDNTTILAESQVDTPLGIAISYNKTRAYAVDSMNYRIREFSPFPTMMTLPPLPPPTVAPTEEPAEPPTEPPTNPPASPQAVPMSPQVAPNSPQGANPVAPIATPTAPTVTPTAAPTVAPSSAVVMTCSVSLLVAVLLSLL